ncbi:restriction endonuclease subunit S [Streptomyces nondiastaticus]|uniref:Type I restriction modification DNA specificity domain-containing protein n=1 Tax=Streptomyces nondiastaticus TaxID=3154512 RepID=A0ABW6TZ05_9ACTN
MSDWQQVTFSDLQTPSCRQKAVPPQGGRDAMSAPTHDEHAAKVRAGWVRAPLARFLTLNVETVDVEPTRLYPTIGVLNRGRGLLYRDPVAGSSTSYKKLNRILPQMLIYSRLKAFEGAITVTPDDLPESFASQEFPTFAFAPDADPDFFRILTTTQSMWDALQGASKGMGGRRERVKPTDFLNIVMDIPPPPLQKRVVELLDAVDDQISALDTEANALSKVESGLRRDFFSKLDVSTVSAGEKFEMQLGRQKSARQSVGDHVHPYLRAANIGIGTLDLSDLKTMNFEPREQGKYAVFPDDVLLVEGGSVGQAALWTGEVDGFIGFDKHVIRIRAREGVSTPEYALQWCHWARETGQFAGQATGITIKALGFSRACSMGVPDLPVAQQAKLTGSLAAAAKQVAATRAEADRLRQVRAGLLSGLLDRTIEIESVDLEV